LENAIIPSLCERLSAGGPAAGADEAEEGCTSALIATYTAWRGCPWDS